MAVQCARMAVQCPCMAVQCPRMAMLCPRMAVQCPRRARQCLRMVVQCPRVPAQESRYGRPMSAYGRAISAYECNVQAPTVHDVAWRFLSGEFLVNPGGASCLQAVERGDDIGYSSSCVLALPKRSAEKQRAHSGTFIRLTRSA